MSHIIKSVNLGEETDLSLEQLDSRMEFLAVPAPVAESICGTFTICGKNGN